MAAKTKISKSARMRELFEDGKSVKEVVRIMTPQKVGYAFAYGVAKRGGYAETAATRRAPANAKVSEMIRWMEPNASDARIAKLTSEFVAGNPKPGARTAK